MTRLRSLLLVLFVVLAWPGATRAAEDFYYHQSYNMGGRGMLSFLDFHYTTQGECAAAVAKMKSLMLTKYPTWQQTSGHCSQQLSPLYRAMLNNERLNVPYVSFRDMRQWVEGVPAAAALNFCMTTARESRFNGQAVCVR